MKCRVCGYDLDPNKAFCDMCGTRTVPPEASPESAQRETNVPHSLFSHPFSAGETMPPAEVPTHRESRPHVSQAPWPTEPPLCEQAMARLKKADDLFDEEFSWNVHDFPKPKKPRDIPIEWPDYDAPETRAKFIEQSEGRIQEAIDKKEPVVLVSSDASEGFIAVPDAPVSSWNEPLAGVSLHDERARPTDYQLHDERAMPSSIPQPDAWTMPAAPPATDDLAWLDEQIKSDPVTREEERFFTFQKKNEEFQRLLDQEQERINSRKYGEPYRDGAGCEGESDTPHIVRRFLRQLLHFVQRKALFCSCTCDFVHEQRAGHPATPHGIQAVLDGDVVIDLHRRHLQPIHAGEVRRVGKIHDVAAIVLDDEQRAFVARRFPDRLVDLNLRGRRKDVAADRDVQHALPDKPGMRRLVTAAAAADQRHFVPVFILLVQKFVVAVQPDPGVRQGDSAAHLQDDVFDPILNFLHLEPHCILYVRPMRSAIGIL
jgi:hypothetical protein